MRKKFVQMSLSDIYHSVEERLENDKPELFRLLDEYLDWDELIPDAFYRAFYLHTGRKRKYELESFLRALFLQRIFHYVEDSQLLNTLRFSRKMRDFCGFHKVPDASKLTRFKQTFCGHLRSVFERLVDLTEPICRKMDKALSDLLIFDTTGIEGYVAENNPKFPRNITAESYEYTGVSASNPHVKLQYINGHFCYAQRAAILTNGLGIVRHLELFDDGFRACHPEMPHEKRTRNPKIDKEIGDSTALKPVLMDFRKNHPNLRYGTFVGDAAFDSYDNYRFLLTGYHFTQAVIPINPRNSAASDAKNFNENGTPLCPRNGTPLRLLGKSGGKKRSLRLKYICPNTKAIRLPSGGATWQSFCKSPCTDSKCGKCVYIYPDKNLRMYPGISRDCNEFALIFNRRTAVKRTINTLKDTLGAAGRKTSNVFTAKADLFLAGIVQLLCVLLADKLHDTKLARRPRRLIAA